ncbi:MAG: DEDD exonuclease domain-containing protein [Chloroherpetonaceae bacterium]|nr:DEDD exonuclease domain-containing protein [Chloroherpetonaceae bacterium]
MKILDATFTVIDVETTGGANPANRVIEVSALKTRRGDIIGELTTLLNPEIPISYFITQYTGITNEMARHAPKAKEILPALLELIGESVFVAHNAAFDFAFVNFELERNGFEPLRNRSLCTVRLARRLLPKRLKKNLGDLAAYFGIEISARHRARGDSEATLGVLYKLIEIAEEKHRVEHLDELLSLQYKPMRVFKREPKHVRLLRETTLPNLPAKPGVYFFYSERGELLYVGKSKNLKSRVSSYFADAERKADKVKELTMTLRRIEWQVTGSELEALLLESKLIKRHKPRYNALLKRYKSYPFLRLTNHAFPRLEIAMEIENDGAEYFGPFQSLETARLAFAMLNRSFSLRECSDDEFEKGRACAYLDLRRCLAPCEPWRVANGEYEAELHRVRKFLSGEDAEIIERLSARMKALACDMRFEEAAELRERVQSLKRVFYRQAAITASINEHNVLILLPSATYSDVCKEFVILFVRFGRLAAQETLLLDDALSLLPKLREIYFNGESAPKECQKEEIDEMRILSSWIYRNRETLSCLYVRASHSPETLLQDLVERLCALSNLDSIEFVSEAESADDHA